MKLSTAMLALLVGSRLVACSADTEDASESGSAATSKEETKASFDWSASVVSYAGKGAPPIFVQSALAKYDAEGEYVPSTAVHVGGAVIDDDGASRAADYEALSDEGALRCRAMALHGEPGNDKHAIANAQGGEEANEGYVHFTASLEVDDGALKLVIECCKNVVASAPEARPITFQQIVDALRDDERGVLLGLSDAEGVRTASK